VRVLFELYDDTTLTPIGDFYVGGTVSSAIPEMSIPLTAAYRVTGSASRTVLVVGHRESGTGSADVFWTGTLTYVPFGSTGTDALRETDRPGGGLKATGKLAERVPPQRFVGNSG
jgi:hypothetical protein